MEFRRCTGTASVLSLNLYTLEICRLFTLMVLPLFTSGCYLHVATSCPMHVCLHSSCGKSCVSLPCQMCVVTYICIYVCHNMYWERHI